MRKFLTKETFNSTLFPSHNERDIQSAYNQREFLAGNESVKQPLREMVMQHMLTHHKPNKKMRLFSMPGLWWTFERQMQDQRKEKVYTVAVERSRTVFNQSVHIMPGTQRSKLHERFPGFDITGISSERAKLLFGTAGAYFSPTCWENWSKEEHRHWSRVYTGLTAIWLDLQCVRFVMNCVPC